MLDSRHDVVMTLSLILVTGLRTEELMGLRLAFVPVGMCGNKVSAHRPANMQLINKQHS